MKVFPPRPKGVVYNSRKQATYLGCKVSVKESYVKRALHNKMHPTVTC